MFVHGFASDASTWNVTAPALHHDLMLAPVQPTLHWYHTEENQAIELLNILNVDPIAGSAASLPFVAHSNGGVVSREYARTAGSRINGLVSVASPHMGAPIAVNWMNGAVLQYGHDLALAVLDPVSFYDQNDWHALPIWLYNYSGAIVNFMYNLAGLLCGQNIGFCIDQATNQVIPMVRSPTPTATSMA